MKSKITIKGQFKLNGKIWDNHIMNGGLIKLLQTLDGDVTTNLRLRYIQFGTSDATPDDRTLTALVAATGPKFLIESWSVNASFPFDLELTVVVPDDQITRPATIKEVGIFYEPSVGGTLFARAVKSAGMTFGVGEDVPVSYSLIIV